jgi:hypothetical protein
MAELFDRHYRWLLDQPVPAPGDVTPRAAAATAEVRGKLIGWLKYLENGEARRARGKGVESYDLPGCGGNWGCSTRGAKRGVSNRACMLEAFLAALALLRPGKNHELDYEYICNLVPDPLRPGMEMTRETVIKAALRADQQLPTCSVLRVRWFQSGVYLRRLQHSVRADDLS